jgi:DNA integrity scanning protein DisA with diadenylate cyclase activity
MLVYVTYIYNAALEINVIMCDLASKNNNNSGHVWIISVTVTVIAVSALIIVIAIYLKKIRYVLKDPNYYDTV